MVVRDSVCVAFVHRLQLLGNVATRRNSRLAVRLGLRTRVLVVVVDSIGLLFGVDSGRLGCTVWLHGAVR